MQPRQVGVVFRMLVLASLGGLAVPLSAQTTGSVRGRVVDVASRAPIAAVNVRIAGTPLGTVTDDQGRYLITRVPTGQVTVAAERIGFRRQTQTVVVSADQIAPLDFAMEAIALSLEAVVVTPTGDERRREMGNAPATINAASEVESAPVNSVSDLLTGRAAGVQVMPSGGTTGQGARIRIRGSNSVSLSNEPIVYVDGVRVSNDNSLLSYETGGFAPSRLNDIAPEQIETIEVVKGPSAATLYGTDAANGVIWITTKRGAAGRTRWNAYSEMGTVRDPYTYPASYRGVTSTGDVCVLADVAAGSCTQSQVLSFNALEHDHTTPFRTGNLQQYGLSASGGGEIAKYFVSVDQQREAGVLPVNGLRRVNLRGNFDATLARSLFASLSTSYLSSVLNVPNGGNYELGIIGNGLAGQGTESILGGYGFFPQRQLLSVQSLQNIQRFTGSTRLRWLPASFLSAQANVGIDNVGRADNQLFLNGQAPEWLGYQNGARFSNRFQGLTYTADVASTAKFSVTPALASNTSVGVQYVRDLFTGTRASGYGLVTGSQSIGSAARTESSEQTIENIKVGAFVQEQLAFRDRLFVTGALRADNSSAFGKQRKSVLYPKLSASWVISEESFFPARSFLGSLRLRAAAGSSGLQPGSYDALRYYTPFATTVDGTSVTGVRIGGLGNPNLKPERSSEVEGGLDAQLLGDRLGLELTFYSKRTRDALVFRELPPSLGVTPGRFENLGSVRNAGLEALVTARPIDGPAARWQLTLNGALNDNKLLSLGAGIPPIVFGVQRHVVGYPLGGYWQRPIVSFADANGDGIIAQSEVTVGPTPVFLGSPFPRRQLSFRSDLTLFSLVRLGALLDYRGGMKLYNSTGAWRDLQNITYAMNVPSAPLADQARAVAATRLGTNAGYIEKADFVKLRELSITLLVPSRYTDRLRLGQSSLMLAGRNLWTRTDYSGLDPEVNQVGQANFVTSDFMSQPPARYYTVRLNLSY